MTSFCLKHSVTSLAVPLLTGLVATGTMLPGRAAPAAEGLQWHAFPDNAKFQVLGLPWFAENQPKLWRMPAKEMASLSKGVQGRSKCPSGGRILLKCNTSRLALRAEAMNGGGLRRFETFVNGTPCLPPATEKAGGERELILFQGLDHGEKEIIIYLPHLQEVVIKEIGVDAQTRFSTPAREHARALPVVFYGSSVCQGSGAVSPAQTYGAILCRELSLDFINLGFGGAGKAESEVVALVNSNPGCAYVFDLGKSYGDQDATAFRAMLRTIRQSHPTAPILVLTPITSTREMKDPAYSERSLHTRKVMRDPANELIKAGDAKVILIEGEDLLGFKEHAFLSKDGVHPSDAGYGMIAKKLSPILKRALGL